MIPALLEKILGGVLMKNLFGWIFTNERLIKWISAFIFATVGYLLGMKTQEVKDAACSASVIEQAKPTEAK